MRAAAERRASRRWQPDQSGAGLSCRIRPGQDATVVNLSAGGVLLDTRRRLVPGGIVDLQLEAGQHRAARRATVLRCGVGALRADAVVYRGALRFAEPLPVGELLPPG